VTRVPAHPLLFAAYAVLFLYAENLSEVLLVDAGAPLVRAVIGAAAALAVLGIVYRSAERGAIVATALVVAFFAYGHVASVVADATPNDALLLAGWGLVIGVAAVYAARARSVAPLTRGLNLVAVVLVGLVGLTIVPYEVARAGRQPVTRAGPVTTGSAVTSAPDVYFLVFDRYGSADAIERRFGLTGTDLYGWLASRGFQVPADSRAAYRATDFSLASTLNMQYLDDLTEDVGRDSGDRTPAAEMIAQHEVGRFLKEQGYRYYHIGSWFDPTASIPIADENLGFGTTSEFESVLRDTTILPALDRVRGVTTPETTFRDRHREGTLFAFRQLHRLATAPGPKFVFAHILLPHDPYVFRADGSLITEAESRRGDERDLYAGQVAFANANIKSVVDELLAGPDDSDPIVIVQGDEGPLLCRNVDCPEVSAEYAAIRFGVLSAMYLPGVDEPLPSTFTSVNTFRTVFREYFGADLPNLPDHSYTWPDNDHIYDFREVTDLLAQRDQP
jgi:Sulfatase